MSEPEPIKSIIERVLNLIEEDPSMSEKKLCEKCKEIWDDLYWGRKHFVELVKAPSFFHCHHEKLEEKPKEKCWCEYPSNQRHGTMRANTRYGPPKAGTAYDSEWFFFFCGACGKRLWGI